MKNADNDGNCESGEFMSHAGRERAAAIYFSQLHLWKSRPNDSISSECEKESLSSNCNEKASNI